MADSAGSRAAPVGGLGMAQLRAARRFGLESRGAGGHPAGARRAAPHVLRIQSGPGDPGGYFGQRFTAGSGCGLGGGDRGGEGRSEEHTSELQSLRHLVCRLLLEKKKKKK